MVSYSNQTDMSTKSNEFACFEECQTSIKQPATSYYDDPNNIISLLRKFVRDRSESEEESEEYINHLDNLEGMIDSI